MTGNVQNMFKNVTLNQIPGVNPNICNQLMGAGYDAGALFGAFLLKGKDTIIMDVWLSDLIPDMTVDEREACINYLAQWGDAI